jgi:glutaredoxin-like YruB-family protein
MKRNLPVKIILVLIILLLTGSLAGGEMYQWTAEDGSVTFKDTPPPPSKKRKKVKVYEDGDFAPAPPRQTVPDKSSRKKHSQTAPAKRTRFSGTVEIYVTDWCGYCKQALAYMSSNGISFNAYNIEKDSSANQRYKELGGRGVPLIIIGNHKMSGFSPENLEYYLSK